MNRNKISCEWWNYHADKIVVYIMLLLHVIALCALLPSTFSWSGVVWFFVLYWVSGGLGITLCYHRLLTHRAFKTQNWLRSVLTFCACLAMQGSPIIWVGTHRHHHKHSDKDLDPHSPIHGIMWAHMIWVLTKVPLDFFAEDFASDLRKEKMMKWFHRYWWAPQVIVSIFLIALGLIFGGVDLAISWFVWGIALRTVAVFHSTWFVNSVTHVVGYKNFHDTGDNSRNLWWVALLSFGEGWHNNHHKYPSSASHGMRWFEFDITYRTIKLMEFLGLAWDVKEPPEIS